MFLYGDINCDDDVLNFVFTHRILVGLPSAENREMILRTLLAKETDDKDLNMKELALLTEGYTGSDLKVII